MVKRTALLTFLAITAAGTMLFAQESARPESRRRTGMPPAPMAVQTRPAPVEIAAGKPRAADQRAQVQVEVYELKVKDAHVPEIDTGKLAQAARAQFLANLKEIGEARLVHMIDVPMLLDPTSQASVRLGSRVPLVQDVSVSSTGTVTPSVNYQDIGLAVKIRGVWVEDAKGPYAEAMLAVEWSGVGNSTVDIAKDVKLPVFTQFKLEQSVQASSGQALVFLARQPSTPRDDSEGATLGLVRVIMTQMK